MSRYSNACTRTQSAAPSQRRGPSDARGRAAAIQTQSGPSQASADASSSQSRGR